MKIIRTDMDSICILALYLMSFISNRIYNLKSLFRLKVNFLPVISSN